MMVKLKASLHNYVQYDIWITIDLSKWLMS